MPLAKIFSLLKGVCNKIFTCWKKASYLLNPEQTNSEKINFEQTSSKQTSSEQNNSEQRKSEQTSSEQTSLEKRDDSLVKPLETKSQQDGLTSSKIIFPQTNSSEKKSSEMNLSEVNSSETSSSEVNSSEMNLSETNSSETNLSEINLENKVMINVSMLQDTLQSFVTSTPDVQGVALVSPDGLSLASVLPTQMDEERTAAMSASILSLGERIGGELARGNVERIVVRGEKGYSLLVGCGSEAVLLVLANSSAKKGLLFLESKRVVSEILKLLS